LRSALKESAGAAEPYQSPAGLLRSARPAPAFWLWPNLLSLDAPLVAVLWQLLFARCFRIPAGPAASVLLVVSVWLIYSADRMLDAWRGAAATPRHEFYRRHWRAVLPVWGGVFGLAACLSWLALSPALLDRGLWLLAGVALYFTAVHAAPKRIASWWKEAVVGVFFALGATAAAWSDLRNTADLLAVLLFSCLCWINCAAIEQWEGAPRKFRIGIAAACVGFAAILFLPGRRPVLCVAELASALAFVALDSRAFRMRPDLLRVLADAALLSPIFLLPLAGMRS
jgi:hypothetical protein